MRRLGRPATTSIGCNPVGRRIPEQRDTSPAFPASIRILAIRPSSRTPRVSFWIMCASSQMRHLIALATSGLDRSSESSLSGVAMTTSAVVSGSSFSSPRCPPTRACTR